jgi:hypothetical protein
VLKPEDVAAALARGSSDRAGPIAAPRGSPSATASAALNLHPRGHTRLPRYVRGTCRHRRSLVHGGHVFPDRHASTAPGEPFDDRPEWLYTVAFDGR